MSTTVLGVDGARGGWLVAEHAVKAGLTFLFAESLTSTVQRLESGEVEVVAVDMPIGLSGDGERPADTEARKRLGSRRSTFFPTPIRSILDFDEYSEANAHSKSLIGKGLSKQAWNLIPKIREVDSLWSPKLADRLVEAHPEASFAQLAGSPVMSKKATVEGRDERLGLLRGPFGSTVDSALEQLPRSLWVDALDAAIAAWTARRIIDSEAVCLGGELDPAGRPMRLHI